MIGSNLDQPGVSSVPDEALMKAVSRRRYDALAELYDRHGKRLRATIDGVVHEEAEADDVLQEIFIQIWEEAERYSPKAGKPLGWMVTIARRRAIDRLRRRQAYSRVRERYQNAGNQRDFKLDARGGRSFHVKRSASLSKEVHASSPATSARGARARVFQGTQP